MSKSGFQVTFDEIQTYDWQAVCAKKVDANTLWDVSTVFFERATELHSKGDVFDSLLSTAEGKESAPLETRLRQKKVMISLQLRGHRG